MQYNGKEVHNIIDKIDVSKREDDIYHETKEQETLRDISYSLYADARLYRLIADFNNIQNVFSKLESGKILRCPALSRIYEEYLNF